MEEVTRKRSKNMGFSIPVVAIGAMLACGTTTVMAQAMPTLRVMIGLPPGGTLEVLTRLVAERIKADTNRTVIVDNRPGALSQIAIEQLKMAAPDGNTILILPIANTSVLPHTYRNLGYNPFTDLAPVSQVATFDNAFAVGPEVPTRTLAEYVALVKREPKRGDYGILFTGSIRHFAMVMFTRLAGIDMTMVPYKGGAQVLLGLMGGEIGAAMLNEADLSRFHQSGKVRVLATTGLAHSVILPGFPTFRGSRYDIIGTGCYGFFAPGKTPATITARLAAAINEALRNTEMRQRFADVGPDPTGTTPTEFAAVIRADYERWGPVIKQSGFVAE